MNFQHRVAQALKLTDVTSQRPKDLLKCNEVQERLNISRATLYSKLNPKDVSFDPAFPVQIRIGKRAVRWLESEVEAYIAALPRTRCAKEGEQ